MTASRLRPSDLAFGALGFLLALLVHNVRALILRGAFLWGGLQSLCEAWKERR